VRGCADAHQDQPRFMRAAETAESLQHPSITKVIDSGMDLGA